MNEKKRVCNILAQNIQAMQTETQTLISSSSLSMIQNYVE